MSLGSNLRTAARIPPRQIAERARALLRRRIYAARPERPVAAAAEAAAGTAAAEPLPRLPLALVAPEGLDAVRARAEAFARGRFEYLRHAEDFSAGIRWDAPGTTPLWRYQLQYLGSVLDLALAGRTADAGRVLASWREAHGTRWDREAWHPYPASLRLANLCHAAAACGGFEALGAGTTGLAAAHAAYVLGHLEHDVRGNHLLENLRALVVASRFLRGPLAERCAAVAVPLLDSELEEQILPDGAHFELSPMYHCVVASRLRELGALLGRDGGGADEASRRWAGRLRAMDAFTRGTLCPSGDFPLLGDSAWGFVPRPPVDGGPERRGVLSFPDSGIHVFRGEGAWAVLDAGPVCPDYLPAHGQADSLTVEAWFGGRRVVGDPGVCEYSGPERAWGRSSRAHSTVTVDDRDTSEVFGSFRVGGRARVERVMVRRERDEVTAVLVPWGVPARFTRIVRLAGAARDRLRITDDGTVPAGRTARSRLHLAPGVRVAEGGDGATSLVADAGGVRVRIAARNPVRLEPGRSSPEFGLVVPTTILVQDLRREEGRDDVHGGWSLAPDGSPDEDGGP